MIDINFFEKEKVNILPYLVAGIFFLLLILMGIYFFFARVYFSDIISYNDEWLEKQAEEVAVSRQMDQLDQEFNETIELQENLKRNQYPMNKITEEVTASISDDQREFHPFNLKTQIN